MKNSECEIHITTKKGWVQKYRKEKDGWIQITNGITRHLTSEQLLSHILPLLVVGNEKNFTIRVIPDNDRKN